MVSIFFCTYNLLLGIWYDLYSFLRITDDDKYYDSFISEMNISSISNELLDWFFVKKDLSFSVSAWWASLTKGYLWLRPWTKPTTIDGRKLMGYTLL